MVSCYKYGLFRHEIYQNGAKVWSALKFPLHFHFAQKIVQPMWNFSLLNISGKIVLFSFWKWGGIEKNVYFWRLQVVAILHRCSIFMRKNFTWRYENTTGPLELDKLRGTNGEGRVDWETLGVVKVKKSTQDRNSHTEKNNAKMLSCNGITSISINLTRLSILVTRPQDHYHPLSVLPLFCLCLIVGHVKSPHHSVQSQDRKFKMKSSL